MESDGNDHQHKRNAGQEFNHLPPFSGDSDSNPSGVWENAAPASQVMSLAINVAEISTDIYELVAKVAEYLDGNETKRYPTIEELMTHLRITNIAILTADNRFHSLASKFNNARSEILDPFLEDCLAALETFTEVSGRLARILNREEGTEPSDTAVDSLSQIMQRLERCSDKVSSLPQAGLTASVQILAETAFTIQKLAGALRKRDPATS